MTFPHYIPKILHTHTHTQTHSHNHPHTHNAMDPLTLTNTDTHTNTHRNRNHSYPHRKIHQITNFKEILKIFFRLADQMNIYDCPRSNQHL